MRSMPERSACPAPPPTDAVGVGGPGRAREQVRRHLLAARCAARGSRRPSLGRGGACGGRRSWWRRRSTEESPSRRTTQALLSTVSWLPSRSAPLQRGELSATELRPPRRGGGRRPRAGSISRRAIRAANVVGGHGVARRASVAEHRLARWVARHPLPTQRLRERGAQHAVAAADRGLPDARLAHARVPALDVGARRGARRRIAAIGSVSILAMRLS